MLAAVKAALHAHEAASGAQLSREAFKAAARGAMQRLIDDGGFPPTTRVRDVVAQELVKLAPS